MLIFFFFTFLQANVGSDESQRSKSRDDAAVFTVSPQMAEEFQNSQKSHGKQKKKKKKKEVFVLLLMLCKRVVGFMVA